MYLLDTNVCVDYLNGRYASVVERMGTHRAPVAVYARGCEAAIAYESLWREALEKRFGDLRATLGSGGLAALRRLRPVS